MKHEHKKRKQIFFCDCRVHHGCMNVSMFRRLEGEEFFVEADSLTPCLISLRWNSGDRISMLHHKNIHTVCAYVQLRSAVC